MGPLAVATGRSEAMNGMTICSVPGCGRPAKYRRLGLCTAHRQRLARGAELRRPIGPPVRRDRKPVQTVQVEMDLRVIHRINGMAYGPGKTLVPAHLVPDLRAAEERARAVVRW